MSDFKVTTTIIEKVCIEYTPDQVDAAMAYCHTHGYFDSLAKITTRSISDQLDKLTITKELGKREELNPTEAIGKITHVDDFIDTSFSGHRYARWFFFLHRLAAVYAIDWEEFISQYLLFCTYQGTRWRVTGASRFGDIWLAKDFNRTMGYDKRVNLAECSEWSPTADTPTQAESEG